MGNYNILVVDDDPIVLKMLEIALEAGGYCVKIVSSGREAIESLHRDTFDIVITDIQMSEPDGFAVLRAAKDLNPLSGLIVMTGNQDVSSAIEAIRIGIDDYFLKPFSPNELLDRVGKIFENRENKRKASVKTVKSSPQEEQIQAMMLIMSHDIRSALITMGMEIRFLQKKADREKLSWMFESLEILAVRCGKLTALAEEYLGKIFSLRNNTDSKRQGIDLIDEIIGPVLDDLSVDIEEKGIAVDNSINNPVGQTTIFGDRVQLKAVFRNVLHNAIKHGGQGCTIGFDLEDQHDHYRLAVFNDGPVIGEQQQNTLFRQVPSRMQNNHDNDGFGIGLYLTRNIMLKHGGDIRYQQIDGIPHFVFTLPKDRLIESSESDFNVRLKASPSMNMLRCR